MDNIYDRLNGVMRDVFDDDGISVTAATTADDVEDWDSLNHITLMGAVESEFGLKLKMGEISGLKNVGELVEIIKARGKNI